MATLTVENRDSLPPVWRRVRVPEFALRILAAVFQIVATVAVVETLAPPVAGIYFRGVVIAYGLAALLRGKYELFIAEHFVDLQKSDLGEQARAIVRGLGIRVLVRSTFVCALLLVITTDLDVVDVYLRPYLETYLPFMLAVPFATLALFLASTLRAVNQTLGSVLVASYSINVMIILAAATSAIIAPDTPLVAVSWGYFIGCVLACGIGVLLTRYVFATPNGPTPLKLDAKEWRDIYTSAGRNGVSGAALAALQWGPLCILAVLGTPVQIAQYAVVTRTAQIIDFLVPSVVFIPQSARIRSRLCEAMRSSRGKLAVDLLVSLATTSIFVLLVGILTPWLVSWYGAAYAGLTDLFLLLYLTQWVNGTGRPAIRQLAADWDLGRIRRIMLISTTGAIALTLIGIGRYGPVAAAVGVLAGAVLLNGQALLSTFGRDGGPRFNSGRGS
jgi:O-antigen/teichoic acid export membrane protein